MVSPLQRATQLSKLMAGYTESVSFCAFEQVGMSVAP